MDLKLRFVSLFLADGKLRPLWRVLCFFWIGTGLSYLEGYIPTDRFPVLNGLTFQAIITFEGLTLVNALIATAIFGWYEKRRIDSYGLPFATAFRGPFWDGIFLGVVAPGVVGIGMIALHGWVIHGFNLQGAGWLVFPLGWIVANLFVGVAEESWYRGYILQTLTKSLGFWPAAIALSLLFTSDHYFYKTGENVYDVITLFSFGIFQCLSVRRTGTLWFAVGFHIAFDFMQLFIIGTKNGAAEPVGTLLKSTFPGPAWINGGVLGTEASVLVYPVTVLMFAYLLWRYPRDKQEARVGPA